MTDERSMHLKNLLDQQKTLASELDQLQKQVEVKRQTYFKLQGAIEYLTGTGVQPPVPVETNLPDDNDN